MLPSRARSSAAQRLQAQPLVASPVRAFAAHQIPGRAPGVRQSLDQASAGQRSRDQPSGARQDRTRPASADPDQRSAARLVRASVVPPKNAALPPVVRPFADRPVPDQAIRSPDRAAHERSPHRAVAEAQAAPAKPEPRPPAEAGAEAHPPADAAVASPAPAHLARRSPAARRRPFPDWARTHPRRSHDHRPRDAPEALPAQAPRKDPPRQACSSSRADHQVLRPQAQLDARHPVRQAESAR